MMKIGIPDDYADVVRTLPSFAKLSGHAVSIWTDAAPDTDALADRFKDVEALLLRERTPISAALVARLPRLKLITISGPYPNIDVAACTAHGIAVCASANRASMATPELTRGLIMAAMRHIPDEVARLKAGAWRRQIGRVLHGRRLGIYGFGRIGKVLAGYGRAFGIGVLVWSRERGRAEAARQGFEVAAGPEELFTRSDVLSIHPRLKPETRGCITRADLARMQPDALFVNTSRAELIEAGALIEALRAGGPARHRRGRVRARAGPGRARPPADAPQCTVHAASRLCGSRSAGGLLLRSVRSRAGVRTRTADRCDQSRGVEAGVGWAKAPQGRFTPVFDGLWRRAHVCVAGMIPAERGHGAKVRLRPPYRFRLTPPSD
jgi:D-3-phosphoglycerate dehydrogenase